MSETDYRKREESFWNMYSEQSEKLRDALIELSNFHIEGDLYVIGKSSRYMENEIVTTHPYSGSDTAEVRALIHKNRADAQKAAKLAEESNPVGFVVLRYRPENK